MANQLQRYRHLKNVPRPGEGRVAMFVLVLATGEEILTCMFSDGEVEQVMDAETTRAQLESLEREG